MFCCEILAQSRDESIPIIIGIPIFGRFAAKVAIIDKFSKMLWIGTFPYFFLVTHFVPDREMIVEISSVLGILATALAQRTPKKVPEILRCIAGSYESKVHY